MEAPFPSTTDSRKHISGSHFPSKRFARPIAFQDILPKELLPDELKDGNPLGIMRHG